VEADGYYGCAVYRVVGGCVYSFPDNQSSVMKTYCILHKECHGCADGLMYSARFYGEPVDASTPFNLLPKYDGSCALRMIGNNCHATRLVFQCGKFENHHHLDLALRILEHEPHIETVTFDRHKASGELVQRTVKLIDRIRFLSR
jgi:hypothetical protein